MAELLAPAGSKEALTAALQAGADSVYFGISGLNMRAGGKADFTAEELPAIVEQAHNAGAKAYLALNVVTYDQEQDKVDAILAAAKRAGVDAVICWDFAVIQACKGLHLPRRTARGPVTPSSRADRQSTPKRTKTRLIARSRMDFES